MAEMTIDTWLYGELAQYAGNRAESGHANLKVALPQGSTLAELLEVIRMPTERRGITFINGQLSAMPGMQPDLDHHLHDGDRVAFFHLNSMWPFQYRFGVAMVDEMSDAMTTGKDQGLHHAYNGSEEE